MKKQEIIDRTNNNIQFVENIVKKSKFIAMAYYVDNKEQAEEIVDKMKMEYKDARHLVYAYMLKEGGRYTDDKEPSGTAGKPIYNLLEKENMVNVLIIVVRYFGGILLGAGPLTRAYANVAKEALDKCEKKEHIEYNKESIICDYSNEEFIKRKLIKENCIIENIERTQDVKIEYLKPVNN